MALSINEGGLLLSLEERSWSLASGDLQLKVTPPELHGTHGSTSWTLPLDFAKAVKSAEAVEIPGLGTVQGLSVKGQEPLLESFQLAWKLRLALNEEGLFLQLTAELGGSPADGAAALRVERLCLADMEALGQRAAAVQEEPNVTTCRAAYRFLMGQDRNKRKPEHSSFLINGWQSFGFSGVLHGAAKQPRTPLPYFSGAFHEGASLHAGCGKDTLVSDMFGLCWLHGPGGLLAGFLGQENAFGGLALCSSKEPTRLLLFAEHGTQLQSGASMQSDWGIIKLLPRSARTRDANTAALSALQGYFRAVALHMRVPACKPQPLGWCSWYCHGPKVSHELMMGSLAAIAAKAKEGFLPFNLFQVDDGWQAAWGDWLTPNSRFPQGLQPIAKAVKEAGLLAGIWLAPAALVAHSRVAKEHPQWLLKDDKGRPLKCGWTAPGLWMHALDTTHPEVLLHVRQIIRTIVKDWGFGYLKCDFLHCAAMPCRSRHDPSASRAKALSLLLQAIREEAGESTYILACGAPLGPCVRHVDAIRVSADTAEHWLPQLDGLPFSRWLLSGDETNLPAGRNMVRSALARLPMHRRLWNNDPDCLILRDDVPLEEARARATVAAFSAGSLIFSDSLEKISRERLAILQALVPPMTEAPRYIDLLEGSVPRLLVSDMAPRQEAKAMGAWHLAALFHWTSGTDTSEPEVPIKDVLPEGSDANEEWHVFDFWSSTYTRCHGSHNLPAGTLEARCCRLFALRVALPDEPQLVGSNVHHSCGLEIGHWRGSLAMVEIALHAARAVEKPQLWLSLPGSSEENRPKSSSSLEVEQVQGEVWRVTLPAAPAGLGEPFCIQW